MDLPVPFEEKVEEDWEMNTYVTCECLGWRGAWNSEERRRAENDLGATLYFGLPYYARWATVAAKVLINKGLITPDELSAKIAGPVCRVGAGDPCRTHGARTPSVRDGYVRVVDCGLLNDRSKQTANSDGQRHTPCQLSSKKFSSTRLRNGLASRSANPGMST